MLVILNNCEHLVQACAELVDHLLRVCLEVTIVVTIREPLRIAGETTWRVPSLSAPGVQQLSSTERLVDYDAVRLFVERARTIRPGFELNAMGAPAVGRVCRQLDGIPRAVS